MKIAKIESFCVSPRWIFVRVETDDGCVGWGESIIPKRVHTVLGAITDLSNNLIGQDPLQIEQLWQKMFRGSFFRGGPFVATAIAGIEQALWDIKGKYYRLPVYEFFGGLVRQRVRAYAWVGGDRPAQVVEEVRNRIRQGFTGIKMNATEELHYLDQHSKIDAVVARVAAVREETGKDFFIALDFHGRVHRAMAKNLVRALEPFALGWIEEPVLSEHNDLLPALVGNVVTPIATGERLYNRWDFKSVFESRVVDVVQPDASLTGLFELEKISRMAEAYDVMVAPHCPNGPICLAATLQVDACVSNLVMQEYSMGIHYNTGYQGLIAGEMQDYLLNPEIIAVKDGYLNMPAGPGLGIEVNEELVRERSKAWFLRDSIWTNVDGTIAEW